MISGLDDIMRAYSDNLIFDCIKQTFSLQGHTLQGQGLRVQSNDQGQELRRQGQDF